MNDAHSHSDGEGGPPGLLTAARNSLPTTGNGAAVPSWPLGEPRYVGAPGAGEGVGDGLSFTMLLHKYAAIAVKHRILVAAICAAALLLGFAITYATTPIYRATATIQIDREAAKVVKVQDVPDITVDSGDDIRFYQTQYDLLRSRSLAEHVAENLDLANAGDFLSPKSRSPWAMLIARLVRNAHVMSPSYDARQAQAIERVQRGLSIAPVGTSRLVKLSFDSPSPEWAQKVANGIADNFIADNLDRRYAATNYARKFLGERLEDLKLKLEDAEEKLVDYATQKQILTDDPHQSLASADMAALNAALQSAKIDRIRAQELWEQARETKGIALPEVLSSTTIQNLLNHRADLFAEYQEKLKQFKPDYPDMRQLQAEIRGMDSEVNAATDAIKNSLKRQYEAAFRQEQRLKEQVAGAKSSLLSLQSDSIQYNILKREADTSRTLYDGLLQQYKDVGVAGAVGTNNISLVDAATLPGAPYAPSLTKNVLISLALGLLVALAVATFLEMMDDTFKTPEEIEEQLGLAVLGIIPVASGDVVATVRERPRAAVSEACRSLRTALQFSTDSGIPKSLLVTSAKPGDGKSTISIALAINLAQLGLRVLVIDADLRKTDKEAAPEDADPGLSTILAGVMDPADVIKETKIPGLSVIGAGPLPPNPAELLAGPRMASLLADAATTFDVTVIDGAPIMGLADAPLLASLVHGTIMVIASGDGRRGAIKGALRRLHFARARVIGTVLNKFDLRKVRYGYGNGEGHGYGYTYAYGDKELSYYGAGGESTSQQLRSTIEEQGKSEVRAEG
jgi:polysaccharide biosynthesis transport protein